MRFKFSFKHMPTSTSLQELAHSKLSDKIRKFVTKPIEAHVTFDVEGKEHVARCSLTGGDGFDVKVEAQSLDMYATVDLLAEKLVAQLKRQKEKLKTHKGRSNVREIAKFANRDRRNSAKDGPDYVDAEDILKYEAARKRHAAGNAQ